jgi:hypothetical protein
MRLFYVFSAKKSLIKLLHNNELISNIILVPLQTPVLKYSYYTHNTTVGQVAAVSRRYTQISNNFYLLQ